MTRAQAIAAWREDILPRIQQAERAGTGRPDYPARSEAWGIYTDELCKGGEITPKQYATWQAPAECGR